MPSLDDPTPADWAAFAATDNGPTLSWPENLRHWTDYMPHPRRWLPRLGGLLQRSAGPNPRGRLNPPRAASQGLN